MVVCGGGGEVKHWKWCKKINNVRKLIILLLFTKPDNINNYYG